MLDRGICRVPYSTNYILVADKKSQIRQGGNVNYILTDWDTPYYNFALEEYLLHIAPAEDYFFLYVHTPSIIVGKHQNAIEEINQNIVEKENIAVARRLSGGGAVYHDKGNLNFSFVQNATVDDMHNFDKFTKPVTTALKKLGINATLSGRNDILIDGQKISGNAQYYKNNRILSHGTLLFDVDMTKLSASLNVKPLKIKSKSIKSISSRVTNIIDHLPEKMTMPEFHTYVFSELINETQAKCFTLDADAIKWIERTAQVKYASWDWIWGNAPAFEIQKIDKFECGIVDVRLNVREGYIQNCKIYGDFFSRSDIGKLEALLLGLPYDKQSLMKEIKGIKLSDFFQGIQAETFATFILG